MLLSNSRQLTVYRLVASRSLQRRAASRVIFRLTISAASRWQADRDIEPNGRAAHLAANPLHYGTSIAKQRHTRARQAVSLALGRPFFSQSVWSKSRVSKSMATQLAQSRSGLAALRFTLGLALDIDLGASPTLTTPYILVHTQQRMIVWTN
ncbi:hypothetical protein M440DRAFT_123289 [Trichoderma longibrachiatum ATCC 18648]|uniref:Uncharacterized protein n=1 Tax=Trichoderma longibrachiatum ATCC 18648 TaxID=983965 RepID=A0A2T4BXA8_TRILO|nr:hypothetical protein M440DRAFT_123289 [Trichoderma longibrachiatum ATCC 18648]